MGRNKKKAFSNTSSNTDKNIGDKIANIVMTLFSIILTVLVIATLLKINEPNYNYICSPNDMLRSIKNEYYNSAIEDMYNNIALGKTKENNPKYSVPYSVAEYCESAFLFTLYSKATGLTADSGLSDKILSKAEAYHKKMESARSGMENLVFMADSIDAVFN